MYIKTIRKYCQVEKATHTYFRLSESYRDQRGFPRQRMVLGLGQLLELPDEERHHKEDYPRENERNNHPHVFCQDIRCNHDDEDDDVCHYPICCRSIFFPVIFSDMVEESGFQ